MHTRSIVYVLLLLVALGLLLYTVQVLEFSPPPTGPQFDVRQMIPARRRVLLWTQMRSGSRWTQSLLMAPSCTFHSEEPLKGRVKEGVNASLTLLSDVLQCRFSQQPDYFREWMNGTQINEYRVKVLCNHYPRLCQDTALTEALCRGACLNLVRVVALDLSAAIPLLRDPSFNGRVIHLVRDPRAVLASRVQLESLKYVRENKIPFFIDEEKNPRAVCARYRQDLVSGRSLAHYDSDRYTLVRYEDLALRTEAEVRRLYTFVGLPYTAIVAYKTSKLTLGVSVDPFVGHPFATRKNSTATAFGWRGRLSFREVESIQQECGDVLHAYGYRLFTSRQDYEDPESHTLLPLRPDLWGSLITPLNA